MSEWLKILKEYAHKVVEGFSSKAGEKIADGVFDMGGSILEFQTKVKHLERDLETLKSVASDIKTQVEIQEQGGGKKRKRQVERWLATEVEIQDDFRVLKDEIQANKVISRLRNVDHVDKLNKKVKKHFKDSKNFGELVLDHHERSHEKLLTGEMYGAAFRATLEGIFDCLNSRHVPIIGIYGGEKAGKTTLAKHIHNKLIDETQDHVYWVSVSENPSIKMLQKDISRAIGLTLSDDNDIDKRATMLYQALRQRKDFVLILDNLRNSIDLEAVGCSLNNEDGRRLLITTPSSKVCKLLCQKTFEVKMDEDEAWNFFKEAYGQDRILPPHQEEFFKNEVNKRCGFPLKIIRFARDPEVEDSEFSD